MRSKSVIRRAATLAAFVLVGASCTATVTPSADPTGASSTASASSTTTAKSSAPSTAAPPTTRALTEAEMVGLLPTAAEIGDGYRIVGPDGEDATDGTDDGSSEPGSTEETSRAEPGDDTADDDAWDEALRDSCPDLVELTSEFSQVFTVAYRRGPISVGREFVDDNTRKVVVELTDDTSLMDTDEQRDDLVRAINRCDAIKVAAPNVGGEMSMTLRANPDSNYGERGLVMTMQITLFGGMLAGPIETTGNVRIFEQGGVTVSITTADGYDPKTFRRVAVDYGLASQLAKRIQGDIEDLQDS